MEPLRAHSSAVSRLFYFAFGPQAVGDGDGRLRLSLICRADFCTFSAPPIPGEIVLHQQLPLFVGGGASARDELGDLLVGDFAFDDIPDAEAE